MKRSSERGSAIIMLFVAVALFGMISYAFLQGSRSNVALLTDEQAKAQAQKIIAYGNDLKSAVVRLRARGCKDTDISFENSVVPGYTNVNNSPNICKIFHIEGGGLQWWTDKTPRTTEDQVTTAGGYRGFYQANNYNHIFRFPDYNDSYDNGTTVGTARAVDLVALGSFLKPEVCAAINKLLNQSPPGSFNSTVPGLASFGSFFYGTYTQLYSTTPLKVTETCGYFPNGGLNHYFYYKLLLAR